MTVPTPRDLPEDLAPRPGRRAFAAAFGLGEEVFLRLRDNEVPGLVTAVTFRPDTTAPLYEVSWGDGEVDTRYEVELCREFSPRY